MISPVDGRELVALLNDACRSADGYEPFSEQSVLEIESGKALVLFVDDAGRAAEPVGPVVGGVGAAVIQESGTLELAVHPESRRRGLGGKLLAAALETGRVRDVWAHGTLGGARALADRFGLTPTRELLVMGRRLDDVDIRPIAEIAGKRFEIATFKPENPEHLAALTELNAAAFAHHPEQGRLTADDFRQRMAQDWFDPSRLVFASVRPVLEAAPNSAADSGETAGPGVGSFPDETFGPDAFLWIKPPAGDASGKSELYVLGVHPRAQGSGLGTALTRVALVLMASAEGATSGVLYVDAENAPAVAAYRRAGFEVAETHTQYATA